MSAWPPPDDLVRFSEMEVIDRLVQAASPTYSDEPWGSDNFGVALPGKASLSRLLEVDGALAGFLVASHTHGEDRPHIHRLAVHPDLHGRGLGGWLLADFISRSSGSITVTASRSNAGALRLYERFGFRQFGNPEPQTITLRLPWLPATSDYRIHVIGDGARYAADGSTFHLAERLGAQSQVERLTPGPRGERRSAAVPGPDGAGWWAQRQRRATKNADTVLLATSWARAALARGLAGAQRREIQARWALWASDDPALLSPPTSERNPLLRAFARAALAHGVDAVCVGPPSVTQHYVSRLGLDPGHILMACSGIDVRQWRAESLDDAPQLPAAVRCWIESDSARLLVDLRRASRPDLISARRILASVASRRTDVDVLALGKLPRGHGFGRWVAEYPEGQHTARAVGHIVSSASCVLIPSTTKAPPSALLGPMALGVPPVAFAVGGFREILGTLAKHLVAAPGDPEGFAECVEWALAHSADPALREALVDRASDFDARLASQYLVAVLRHQRFVGQNEAGVVSRALWGPTFNTG